MRRVFYFLVLIAFFISCRNEKTADKVTAPPKVDTLTFKYDSVKVYSKHIVKTGAKEFDTAKAIVTYPIFENEVLNKYVQRQVLNYFSEEDKSVIAYQDIAKSFINGYDSFIGENHDSEQAWFLIIDMNVLHQKDSYIAIKYTHSDYSGGAHPNTNFSFINYDLKINKAITLDSLINNNKKNELTRIAENIFRKNEKLGPTESLEGKYFFSDGKFSLPENFYISKKGLVFFYNPYEIKAYAYGITELTIPFADLKDIAKPNTILTATN